jgi:anti-sigma regulatory factor (Ser/Thr protein kinase)
MTTPTSSVVSSAVRHWLTPVMEILQADLEAPLRLATFIPGTDAGCAGAARVFTRATLRNWTVTERGTDVVTVVSELVTNAWRHAPAVPGGPVRLGLLDTGESLLCAVADPSPRPPVPREPDPLATSGRGLHVVAALSDSWGWTEPSDSGKTVWARFAVAALGRPAL